MAITNLPSPPARSDTPANFISKADAFIAALPQFVTEANEQAAALTLNSTTDTSVSSNLIGLGAKTFTVSTGKSFQPGMYLVIADTSAPSTNSMSVQVTSYNSGTGALVIDSKAFLGSGTKTAWTISQSVGFTPLDNSVSTAKVADNAVTTAKVADANITNAKLATPLDLYKHGNCVLAKSGANLVLSPRNGNRLIINGTVQTIPAAGVSLDPPATTLTLYWIYAYMNAGVMTLEASTTTHATDATTGIEIKSGDATRTLVGMARTVTNAWVDTAAQRFVRSWFDESPVVSNSAFTANRSTSSTSFVEINTEIRNEILLWSSDAIEANFNGAIQHTNGGGLTYSSLGIDGITPENVLSLFTVASIAQDVTIFKPAHYSYPKVGLTEGYHYFTVLGKTSVGTSTWLGGPTANTSTLHVTARKD